MAKKITLETIAAQIEKMDSRMENSFGAVAEDLSTSSSANGRSPRLARALEPRS